MRKKIIEKKLEKHDLWLQGKEDGKKAVFRSRDFSGLTLSNLRFSRVDLQGVNFENCVLENVTFGGSNLDGSNFKNCLLIGCTISISSKRSDFRGCRFKFCTLSGNFTGSDFENSTLEDCDLDNGVFRGCNFENAKFSKISCENADLNGSYLIKIKGRYFTLDQSELFGVDFKGAKFYHSSFRYCKMGGSNPERIDFLQSCMGNNKEIKSGQLDGEDYVHTKDTMQIGTNIFPIEFLKHGITSIHKGERFYPSDVSEHWKKWENFYRFLTKHDPAG